MLNSFKLKEFADDNFKFDKNGRKFSKRVENTVGKGEIACYKQFLFSTLFSKNLYCRYEKNKGLFGKCLTFNQTVPTLVTLRKKPFENILGKGENADKQHFLFFFPQQFLPFPKQISIFQLHLLCCLNQSEILLFGKDLTHSYTMTPFDAPGKQAF